ncbi:DUF2147 domain-containing protein [Hymenobacter latericus]|uniref:DUF2147 domain-containing protein n=1 Tax=Hymenobacter sp. YIM 151858-1 TaxID=2987688 RepID=UPI002225C783|nr:DUF2147 domain-containing protein [Hymenobacter sp. YIM 151858-1]UYZ60344.1 DUF2147 domain-containing protein [Hymenobacter sp. YIM 151858-1]
MKAIRVLPLLLALALAPWGQLFAQPAAMPLGVWADEQGESHIELYRCGEQLCGKIVNLQQPNDAEGHPRLDVHNPDPKKRTQPHLGLVVLQNLRYDAGSNRWDGGEIYDPENGRTYSCFVRQLGPDKLEVKGYIGFALVGRSQYWTRVRKATAEEAAPK